MNLRVRIGLAWLTMAALAGLKSWVWADASFILLSLAVGCFLVRPCFIPPGYNYMMRTPENPNSIVRGVSVVLAFSCWLGVLWVLELRVFPVWQDAIQRAFDLISLTGALLVVTWTLWQDFLCFSGRCHGRRPNKYVDSL